MNKNRIKINMVMKKESLIHIIILNYYGKSDTLACLESLDKNTEIAGFKVILVNNSPAEPFLDTELYGYKFAVEYVKADKNLGFCGGNNLAIQKSLEDTQCGYIMLLNNDTLVTKGLLKKFKYVCDENASFILNPLIIFYATGKLQCTGGQWSLLFGYARNINKGKQPDSIREDITPFYLNGCCLFARKEVFEKTGLLDKDYFAYGEDIDFSIRAKKLGYNLRVIHDACIYHRHSRTGNPLLKQYLICRNNVLCIRKNYSLLIFFTLCPIHFITQALIGYFVFKNRNIIRLIACIITGYYDGLTNKRRSV